MTSWTAEGQCAQFIEVQPQGRQGTEVLEMFIKGNWWGGVGNRGAKSEKIVFLEAEGLSYRIIVSHIAKPH